MAKVDSAICTFFSSRIPCALQKKTCIYIYHKVIILFSSYKSHTQNASKLMKVFCN